MKVEIPHQIGTLKGRFSRSRNIIFAADNHVSLPSQYELSLLFLSLCQTADVRVVSFEGLDHQVQSEGFSNNPDELSVARGLISTYFHYLDTNQAFLPHGYRDIVTGLVSTSSKPLLITGYEKEPELSRLEGTLRMQEHFLGRAYGEDDGYEEDYSDPQDPRLIRAVDIVRHQIGLSDKELIMARLDKNREIVSIGQLIRRLSFLRTYGQVTDLLSVMEDCQAPLAILYKGKNHLDEFLKVVKKRNVGFGVFIPHGIDARDDYLARGLTDRYIDEFGPQSN